MSLSRDIHRRTASFLIALAACVFLFAWTLSYWQGWLFLLVLTASIATMNAYLLKYDPALAERRMRAGPSAETDPAQKRIQAVAALLFALLVPVGVLDHRFGWSRVSAHLSLLGDGLVMLGFALVLATFKENTFASATVKTHEGQTVVASGPYRLVRHPMYSGAVLIVAGIPLALGSLWGLLLSIALTATFVWRLVKEENYLAVHLPGYRAYRSQTRYRLVPGLF